VHGRNNKSTTIFGTIIAIGEIAIRRCLHVGYLTRLSVSRIHSVGRQYDWRIMNAKGFGKKLSWPR
jgi:hypothetical protein